LFDGIATNDPPYLLGHLRNVMADRFVGTDAFLPPGGKAALLLGALDDTAKWLSQRFGTLDPARLRWGDLNTARFDSPFGGRLVPPPIGVDGFSDTIDVCETPFFAAGDAPLTTLAATEVPLYRMVIGFAADGTPEATVDFTRGTREDPDDPHFGDRQDDWIANRHVPLVFRPEDVARRAIDRTVLPAR
jgi:penicillin amidase